MNEAESSSHLFFVTLAATASGRFDSGLNRSFVIEVTDYLAGENQNAREST